MGAKDASDMDASDMDASGMDASGMDASDMDASDMDASDAMDDASKSARTVANQVITGIHHVTAIVGDPQRNLDFYTGLLGLRLVKITVNYDDPGAYHFYYGDELGRPGTILTFFTYPGALRGRRGTGQVNAIGLAIRLESLDYWMARFAANGVRSQPPTARFDEQVVRFRDPDGLALELVAYPGAAVRPGWASGPIPAEHAIRGVRNVTVWEADDEPTSALLVATLGFRPIGDEGGVTRYAAQLGAADGHTGHAAVAAGVERTGPSGTLVDLRRAPDATRGIVAGGSVHHVAFRTPLDEQQHAWRAQLVALGYHVTPVMDRQYFHSIYFREPGGVLFEIATDLPGFATDETPDHLGSGLKLPRWLEPTRVQVEVALPAIRLPSGGIVPTQSAPRNAPG